MTDDNRFFRWLGRINSVLFLLAAIGVILSVGALYLQPQFVWEQPPAGPVAQKGDDTYEFGGGLDTPVPGPYAWNITLLDRTDQGVMVLQLRGGSSGSVSRYELNRNVNLLLVDLKTTRSRWLFQGLKHDIGRIVSVHESVTAREEKPTPVTALLMPVASTDNNGDGKVSAADAHALYAYRVGGGAPVKVIDAKSVAGVEQLDSDRLMVEYFDGTTNRIALLSAKDFKPLAQSALPATP